jgi:hypothetical protein
MRSDAFLDAVGFFLVAFVLFAPALWIVGYFVYKMVGLIFNGLGGGPARDLPDEKEDIRVIEARRSEKLRKSA